MHSLRFRYPDVMKALKKICLLSKKSDEHTEAEGLKHSIENFEFVLQTINTVSQSLQKQNTDILQASKYLTSLSETLVSLRGFHSLKETAKNLAQSWGIPPSFPQKRARRTKRHFDELCEDERLSNAEEHFNVSVFYAALDTAIAQVTHSFQSMQEVAQRFGFLRPQELLLKSDDELYRSARALADQYKDDLSADFPDQVLSFRSTFMSTIKEIERFGTHSIHKAPLHIAKCA